MGWEIKSLELIMLALFVGLTVYFVVKRLNRLKRRYHKSSSKIITSVDELLEQGGKYDEIFSTISNQPIILKVLQKYGKNPEDIKDVFWTLMAHGADGYIAKSVIENPKLLSQFLQMKKDGISDIEIAFKLVESLGG